MIKTQTGKLLKKVWRTDLENENIFHNVRMLPTIKATLFKGVTPVHEC